MPYFYDLEKPGTFGILNQILQDCPGKTGSLLKKESAVWSWLISNQNRPRASPMVVVMFMMMMMMTTIRMTVMISLLVFHLIKLAAI
jgi:hypothetical protein